MTEDEYLRATNRVKISAALTIVRDVLPGEKWGITELRHADIILLLRSAEEELFASYELSR